MKAKDIFFKTLPFVWAKLLLGLATVLISGILLAVLMGIGALIGNDNAGVIMFVIWLCGAGVVRFFLTHYIGYMLKAGHIAVMVEAVTTGRVPQNQIAYGKQKVTERFATANIYFAVDKLISGAVKQIQRGIGRVGNLLSAIPGIGAVTGLAQFFIGLSLGYIDECCLGYTFYKKEQGAFKSAADGIVIYSQNWKTLLGSAAKTMLMVVFGLIGITLALFILLGFIFRLISVPGIWAFLISFFIALAVKSAFIDSFILSRTMAAYMKVAPSTVITFDLHGKLCGVSAKFKELFNKGAQEQNQQVYAGTGSI